MTRWFLKKDFKNLAVVIEAQPTSKKEVIEPSSSAFAKEVIKKKRKKRNLNVGQNPCIRNKFSSVHEHLMSKCMNPRVRLQKGCKFRADIRVIWAY